MPCSALDVSNNTLSGTIPPSYGMLGSLQYLDLSLNAFSGTLPATLNCLANVTYVS